MGDILACIGGHAAHQLLHERGEITQSLGLSATPYGESQPLFACETPAGRYLFLARNGEHTRPVPPRLVNYRANLWALKEAGAESIVAWDEGKALSHNYRVGQFVLVDDLIDETVCAPLSFLDLHDTTQVRQWPVFCPMLRRVLAAALRTERAEFGERGVYVCVEGHRQETPAEARKFMSFGGDLLGCALAPEAFLAKELQLAYAAVCYVRQYAESGSGARPFERGQVLDARAEQRRVAAAVERLPGVMKYVLTHAAEASAAPAASVLHHADERDVVADHDGNGTSTAPPRAAAVRVEL